MADPKTIDTVHEPAWRKASRSGHSGCVEAAPITPAQRDRMREVPRG